MVFLFHTGRMQIIYDFRYTRRQALAVLSAAAPPNLKDFCGNERPAADNFL
jgi:hypothetical protein